MYCPMKLYLKTHVDISQNDEYQLYNEIKNQLIMMLLEHRIDCSNIGMLAW